MPMDATPKTTPETTVIVRTFNEQRDLPGLFDALDRQHYRDFEVIVVDSGSFDRTREIAEARAHRLIRISRHDFTFGHSLNVGFKAATGSFCVMVSAHTVPCDEDWLETLVAPLREEKTAMSYGRQLGVPSSRFGEANDFERIFGPEPRIERPGHYAANNANAAVRRDLWEQRPFDASLLGLEDIDWAKHWMGLGYRVVYEPRAALHHIHEETWAQIRNRHYREAVAARSIGILRRRHIAREIIKEFINGLVDLGSAFRAQGNPVSQRLTLGQRLREILYFRIHKNIGAIRGLFKSHALETRSEREEMLFDKTSQTVVIDGPNSASLQQLPAPQLNPGDVLIRVAHVAVCATDLEILDGTLGYYKTGAASYPIVPGHEFSGTIVAVGPRVTGLAEGDPAVVECIQGCGDCAECKSGNAIGCAQRSELGVIGRNGAYARHLAAPARFVHRLDNGTDLRRAALTEPLAVVLKGLRRLQAARPGANQGPCAVIGAGPIGHLCAQVLKRSGVQVTAIDRSEKRRSYFNGAGIETEADLKNLSRFSLIIEATGDPDVLNTALHESPANATILLLGLPYGPQHFSFEAIAAFDKTVVGSVGSTSDDFDEAIKLLPELELDEFFKCRMPLEEFEKAWQTSRNGDVLKVILDVDEGIDAAARH
jgi:2-desacetyl-2-hydroxyethyl bacteriochlorophyllide A dehydrogenase